MSLFRRSSPETAPAVLRRGLWLFMLALMLVTWGVLMLVLQAYRAGVIREANEDLAQRNSILALHTEMLFRSVETDLRVVDHWLQAYAGDDPLNDPAFVDLVEDMRRMSHDLIDIRLVDAQGGLRYVPNPERKARADVSDRAYFRVHLGEGERTLHVGDPVLSRVTGKWGIPVSLRLSRDVAGLHVVFAAIELDRLVAPHEQWRIKEHGSILLVRQDGRLLSRAPFDAKLIGKDLSSLPEYMRFHLAPRGQFEFDGQAGDGIPRLVSYEHVQDASLFVVVTRGLDETLTAYATTRRAALLAAGGFSLLVLGFAFFIHRTQRSLFKAQKQIQQQALVDELIQTMNRRAFFLQAGREFARARRQQESLALLMIDLDHFKQVNDHHGHGVGDEVLVSLCALWQQGLRGQDLLGRLGGEEFCVLLPDTGMQDALEIADRLRQLSMRARPSARVPDLCVTISVGLGWLLEADADWQAILQRADMALYQAKENGRNRVEAQAGEP